MRYVTNLLELLGIVLIVSAFGVAFGVAAMLVAAGVACLVASWRVTR